MIPSRRGYTLIELLVAGTLSMVVLTIATPMIGLLMREQSASQNCDADWGRLADQVRRDIRAAERIDASSLADTSSQLKFIFPGGREATYDMKPGALERTSTEGERSTRDTFFLPEESEIRWPQIPARAGEPVELVVSRPVRSGQGACFMKISAILGRDRRWESAP